MGKTFEKQIKAIKDHVIQPLAKIALISLRLTAAPSAADT